MDLGNFALFGMMRRRMDWLTQRQATLAENIANADTPQYKAKDVAPPDFARLLEAVRRGQAGAPDGPVRLAATRPGHIPPRTQVSQAKPAPDKGEMSPAGNDVGLEGQVAKAAETQLDYQTTASLYRKHVAMLKSVLRR